MLAHPSRGKTTTPQNPPSSVSDFDRSYFVVLQQLKHSPNICGNRFFNCMLTRWLRKISLFTYLRHKLCKLKGCTEYAITQRPSVMMYLCMCPFYDPSTHCLLSGTRVKQAGSALTRTNDRVGHTQRSHTHTSDRRDSSCRKRIASKVLKKWLFPRTLLQFTAHLTFYFFSSSTFSEVCRNVMSAFQKEIGSELM